MDTWIVQCTSRPSRLCTNHTAVLSVRVLAGMQYIRTKFSMYLHAEFNYSITVPSRYLVSRATKFSTAVQYQ